MPRRKQVFAHRREYTSDEETRTLNGERKQTASDPMQIDEDVLSIVKTAKALHNEGYLYKDDIPPADLQGLKERYIGDSTKVSTVNDIWKFWDMLEEVAGKPDVKPISVVNSLPTDSDGTEPSSSVSVAHSQEVKVHKRKGKKNALKHGRVPAEANLSLTKYSNSKPTMVLQPSISASDLLWLSKLPQVAAKTQQLQSSFPQMLANSVAVCQLSSLKSVTSLLKEQSAEKHLEEQNSKEVKRKILKQVRDFIQGQNARFERLAEIAKRQNSLLEQFAKHMVQKEQQELELRGLMQQQLGQIQQMEHFYDVQHRQHQQFIHQLRQLQLEFLYELHDHHQCYIQGKGSS